MRRPTKTFLTLACGLLLAAVPGRADDLIFNDLSDTLSVTHLGSADTITGGCALEACDIQVTANLPPCVSLAPGLCIPTIDTIFNDVPPGGLFFSIAEQGGEFISDEVQLIPNDYLIPPSNLFPDGLPLGLEIKFTSDPADFGPGTCFFLGGCSFVENGGVQGVANVNWSMLLPGITFQTQPDHTDFIGFQSDIDPPPVTPVPEAGTLLLLGTGLLGLVGAARRKWLG